MNDKRHIVISGPSGSGKSTVVSYLVKSNPLFKFSVSHTTRPIRPFEKHGIDYFFITKTEFEDMISRNKFLEYAIYNDNYYGTSLDQLIETKKILIMDLDRQGVRALKETGFDFRFVYIYCDKEDLLLRLVKRSKKDKSISIGKLAEISIRLNEYEKDMEIFENSHYDIGIKNVELEETLKRVENFLYQNK
ncbi:guanylate kinase [Gurleya vavrai]